jgi:hypothetical protein
MDDRCNARGELANHFDATVGMRKPPPLRVLEQNLLS